MSRFLMTICFDGTGYHGWQVQENAVTVQQTVQQALAEAIGFRPDITGCSRTDSHVHAYEYCFHFDYEGSMNGDALTAAVNTVLPRDIAARKCIPVNDDFHARYLAKTKRYIYKFYDGDTRNPFFRDYAYHTRHLDENIMNMAARSFVGTYDFSGFCASGGTTKDNVRTVFDAVVYRDKELVCFETEADGFLYNMVRIMSGTLLYVSLGKIKPEDMSGVISSKDRKKAGTTVPAHGLYLLKVNYGGDML